MKTQQEEAVIDAMREYDGELAKKIIDEMFLFENLVEVDDRSIERLLQEVEGESLLVALKGAEQPLREKFLKLTAGTQAMDPEAGFRRFDALEGENSVTGILD